MIEIAHLMTDNPTLSDFLIYHTSDAILRHISISVEIYRSSWSCMIISTYEIHTEMMTCLLSYHDPLVEPLLGHSVRPTLLIFRCPRASSFERCLLICEFDSIVDLDDWDHAFDDG